MQYARYIGKETVEILNCREPSVSTLRIVLSEILETFDI